jgi:hypothetical protein
LYEDRGYLFSSFVSFSFIVFNILAFLIM